MTFNSKEFTLDGKQYAAPLSNPTAQNSLTHSDYTVAWICTLQVELEAATQLLDEKHADLPRDGVDTNLYALGRLGRYNVAIVCLAEGWIGIASAATTVVHMLHTFRCLDFGILVGVGGGVPSEVSDIRLGDVVVSLPVAQFGGIVAWNRGKSLPGNKFELLGPDGRPPQALLAAAEGLSKFSEGHSIYYHTFLGTLINKSSKFKSPGPEHDFLYAADYPHKESREDTCENCDRMSLVKRKRREGDSVKIHYGTIGSGDIVLKDGVLRDTISEKYNGILCFEMEAAGVMHIFPCLVIRGICDYCDSHKNDMWQPYASATAAACAKDILENIPPIHRPL